MSSFGKIVFFFNAKKGCIAKIGTYLGQEKKFEIIQKNIVNATVLIITVLNRSELMTCYS